MDPRLRIHGEHHGEGGKHVPSACPSAKTERERGGKRGEAVGKEAAQGAGAGFGVGVVVARGPASVRAAEAQSAAGVQRDHEGPKSRWSFARRLNDS